MKDRLNEYGLQEYEKAKKQMADYWQDVYEIPLCTYCFTLMLIEKSTSELESQGMVVPYTNKSGATNLIENPNCKVYRDLGAMAMKQASLLGLSVHAKQKIKGVKNPKKAGFDLTGGRNLKVER